MKTVYQKTKSQILTLWQLDRELSGVLSLQMVVIAVALGTGLGVMP